MTNLTNWPKSYIFYQPTSRRHYRNKLFRPHPNTRQAPLFIAEKLTYKIGFQMLKNDKTPVYLLILCIIHTKIERKPQIPRILASLISECIAPLTWTRCSSNRQIELVFVIADQFFVGTPGLRLGAYRLDSCLVVPSDGGSSSPTRSSTFELTVAYSNENNFPFRCQFWRVVILFFRKSSTKNKCIAKIWTYNLPITWVWYPSCLTTGCAQPKK